MKKAVEERSEKVRGPEYVTHRVSPKQSFCLDAGLKILALKRAYGVQKQERRGVYALSDVAKALVAPEAPHVPL